jgi:triacylglycerol lipase
MFRYFSLILSILAGLNPDIPMAAGGTTTGHERECVILLHGIGRSKSSMGRIEAFLSARGYRVVNFDYPSTRESIERIADTFIPKAIAQCRVDPTDKIHFVTHSLGGIIVRQYLQSNTLPEGSRVVMLAPPNHGSELTDYFETFCFYKWIYGPAGQELGTDPESTPNRLKPIDIEVGILAGNRSMNPIFSPIIPGPDDGRVSVDHTTMAEMTDFLVIPTSHNGIVSNAAALKQVAHFLEHGKFDHRGDGPDPKP